MRSTRGAVALVLGNVAAAVHARVAAPLAALIAEPGLPQPKLDDLVYLVAARQVAYALGPAVLVVDEHSLESVEGALGESALVLEELKGLLLGLYVARQHAPRTRWASLVATFVINTLRSLRLLLADGDAGASAAAHTAVLGWLFRVEALSVVSGLAPDSKKASSGEGASEVVVVAHAQILRAPASRKWISWDAAVFGERLAGGVGLVLGLISAGDAAAASEWISLLSGEYESQAAKVEAVLSQNAVARSVPVSITLAGYEAGAAADV